LGEASAKGFRVLSFLISNETWEELKGPDGNNASLHISMIDYLLYSQTLAKIEIQLRKTTEPRYSVFLASSLGLASDLIPVLGPPQFPFSYLSYLLPPFPSLSPLLSSSPSALFAPSPLPLPSFLSVPKYLCPRVSKVESRTRELFLSEMKETHFLGILTFLGGVLLKTGPFLKTGKNPPRLSSEFVKTAIQCLKPLNQLARLSLETVQDTLGREETLMEFFHLTVSIFVSIKSVYDRMEPEVESSSTLMAELLSLLAHFAIRNPKNQESLRMGPSPLISHLSQLPLYYYLHPM